MKKVNKEELLEFEEETEEDRELFVLPLYRRVFNIDGKDYYLVFNELHRVIEIEDCQEQDLDKLLIPLEKWKRIVQTANNIEEYEL